MSPTPDAIPPTKRRAASLRCWPLAGRKTFWTVLIDPETAQPLGFLPLDSFCPRFTSKKSESL